MENASTILAGLALLVTVGHLIFGGGRGLSAQFSELDKSLTQDIAELRKEVGEKQNAAEAVTHDAIMGIRQQMHDMRAEGLEYRIKAAETYMTWDAYREISRDVKEDMKEAFDRVERRLERIEKGLVPGQG
ncbi:hypothetical protein [Afipia felis]|uniref:Uncharacterized protein n=2 Tax=Afipia felis TaxID=1035 RepID=A0A380W6M6_AFIFE|nr:hypothetical protein [Afipia felis]EKS26741.1 hypothetical protein HMPREF9697_03999 [Afipia felis ATCC 53690]SUU76182.1 Uncharacterised protein [Afipia felis]SUU84249.1 Uncharacterised protein [Afipia felis]SUW28253.1 Uncharacterised protein [Afipia felis]